MENKKVKLIALGVIGGLAIIVLIWNLTRGEGVPKEAEEIVNTMKSEPPPEIPPVEPAKQKPAVGFKIKN